MNFGGSVVKNLPANAGDVSLIPGSGRSPGEGNGNPPQYSCLRNPMDRGAWGGYTPWCCKRVGHNLGTKEPQIMNFNFLYLICSDHKRFLLWWNKILISWQDKKKLSTKFSLCIRLDLFPPSLMCSVYLHYILNKLPWR